jgi:hypothetical protein
MCSHCGCRAIEVIEAFSAEHDAILGAAGDLAEAAALQALLRQRVDTEENGLFPAVAVALYGAGWVASQRGCKRQRT